MTVNSLTPNLINLLSRDSQDSLAQGIAGGSASNFSDVLTEAFANVASTDTADKVSGLELLTGQADDLALLMLDAQKAELSLNLSLQIRNKILEAYDEIMRMQV